MSETQFRCLICGERDVFSCEHWETFKELFEHVEIDVRIIEEKVANGEFAEAEALIPRVEEGLRTYVALKRRRSNLERKDEEE